MQYLNNRIVVEMSVIAKNGKYLSPNLKKYLCFPCFIFQDFFQAAWAQMSTKNFEKVPVDALKSAAEQNNQGGVSDS